MNEHTNSPTSALATLIERYDLLPHPEGGMYREYYRAEERSQTARGERSAATSIWFMLTHGDVSHFHRLSSDEIWYWHEGGVAVMHMIDPDGTYRTLRLGSPDVASSYVCVLRAGTWFGATVEGDHVLVSAMVAPGFDFADFELAARSTLLEHYPQHSTIITRLTSE